MSNYAISIGGSGARATEAFIYLCAAGLGPAEKTSLIFVDPDEANHNVNQALKVLDLYRKLRVIKRGSDSKLFQTELELIQPAPWTPFTGMTSKRTLDNYFHANTLKGQSEADSMLFEFLYDQDQRAATLDIGFRGRPSIGAAVFGHQMDVAGSEPWTSVAKSIADEATSGTVKIFAFGSVFGGTGAAGLPTIPKLLGRTETGTKKLNVAKGAALLLPYFSFSSKGAPKDGEVFARPDWFALNAKAAIRYYSLHSKDYDRVYVVGADNPVVQKQFSLGGESQNNKPSYVELLAALGASDFYATVVPVAKEGVARPPEVALIARHEKKEFSWKDIPGTEVVHPAIGAFTRMAFAYLSRIDPHLERIQTTTDSFWSLNNPHRKPWYVNLFKQHHVELSNEEVKQSLDAHKELFVFFLEWLRDLHEQNQGAEGFQVKLADTAAIVTPGDSKTLLGDHFGNLVLDKGGTAHSLRDCEAELATGGKGDSANASGLGFFQRRLHEVCS
jgi:hypothetical protein